MINQSEKLLPTTDAVAIADPTSSAFLPLPPALVGYQITLC